MGFLGVYGHANIDTILLLEDLPARNTTVPAMGEVDRLGGTGATIARAAASLGVPTALATFVGDDFPDEYRRLLADLGIDVTDLRTLPGRTPHCWLLSVPGGDTSSVFEAGPTKHLDEVPLLDYTYLNSEVVHLATGDPAMHLKVAREASRAGKRVVFDPGQELRYRYDDRTLERFLDASWLFVCNHHELELALAAFDYGDPAQLHDHVDNVLVTRGADGSSWLTDGDSTDVPACPVRSDDPPETTGAGDSFRGGLYAALHQGKGPPEALRWASAASSLYLEAEGARLPTSQDLAKRLASWDD